MNTLGQRICKTKMILSFALVGSKLEYQLSICNFNEQNIR